MGKKAELLNCRDVLWYLVFCGFAINYMLRLNLNMTIVAMVAGRPKAAAAIQCNVQEDATQRAWRNDTVSAHADNTTTASGFSGTTPIPDDVVLFEPRFEWSAYQQGLALGAYYWLHWVTQLPGGLLARRYGTKFIYGWGNFLAAILGLLIPFATRYHLNALVFLRVIQGLISGVIWPSMHDMTAKWIPPDERSRFVSSYLGSSVGAAITYPLCAAVSSWLGWEAAFYVTSSLGILWYGAWVFLVYDSPQQHPRITDEEKKYILENLSGTTDNQDAKIPWKEICLSGPVWITIIAHWGGAWGFLTLMTQAPSYFNFVHGWDINATGLLSGAPHVLRMIFSYFYSIMSDWLLRTERMSLTNVRKLATFVSIGIHGIMILGLGFSGCQPTLAVIFMMIGIAANGAVSASTLANFVDLSPNYASILLGFCGMIVIWAGFISPAVVGILTSNNQSVEQWRLVFIIAAVNTIGATIVYMIWGSSDEQAWNQYGKPTDQKSQEMQVLSTKAELKKCEEGINQNNKHEETKLLEEKEKQ